MQEPWREPQVKQSLLRRNSLKAHAVGPIPWPDDGKHWTRQCNYLQQTSKERLEFFYSTPARENSKLRRKKQPKTFLSLLFGGENNMYKSVSNYN